MSSQRSHEVLKVQAGKKSFSIPCKNLSSSEYLDSFFKSNKSSKSLDTSFENIDANTMELLIGFMKNGNLFDYILKYVERYSSIHTFF